MVSIRKLTMEDVKTTVAGTNGVRNYDKELSPGEELKYELYL